MEKKFTAEDWDIVREKESNIQNKVIGFLIGFLILFLAVFVVPIRFLPKSGSVPMENKSQTFFEFVPIYALIFVLFLVLFELYVFIVHLKYFKFKKDIDNEVKIIEKAKVIDFYKYTGVSDEQKMQIVFDINGKNEKINIADKEFSNYRIRKNEFVSIDLLPKSRYVLSISPLSKNNL